MKECSFCGKKIKENTVKKNNGRCNKCEKVSEGVMKTINKWLPVK